METNKHVAKLIDRQHLNKVRSFYRTIMHINMELAEIHRKIEFYIDKEKYKHVTDYVNQYISFTTVWNVKFVYNFENPEIALLQLFHLEYIFNNEPKNRFRQEREIFKEQYESFLNLNIYEMNHIHLRKQKMLDYINKQENKKD